MSRVYIAAPIGEVATALLLARIVSEAGHEVGSSWHYLVKPGDVDPEEERERRRLLSTNLLDILGSNIVLAWTASGTPRATLAEVGFALGCQIPVVWIVGPRGEGRSLFTAHVRVTEVVVDPAAPAVEEVLAALAVLP